MLSNAVITVKTLIVLWAAIELFCRLVNDEDAEWFKDKPRTMMMLFYVVAMWCRTPWILYAVVIGYLPAVARNRAEGAFLAVIAAGALPDLPSYLTAGGATLFQFDKWVSISIGLLIVFVSAPYSGLRVKGYLDLPFLLLLGLEMLQARGMNLTSSLRVILLNLISIAMPYFLITRSITRVDDLRRLMMCLAFLGVVLGCVGLYESIFHFMPYQQLYQTLNLSAGSTAYKFRNGILRASTSFPESTSFALNLVTMLMAAVASRYSFKSTSKLMIAILIMMGAITVTSSRNAWIALIIAIIGFDFFRGKVASFVGKISVLGMAYAVVLLLAQFSHYLAVMVGRSEEGADTGVYRHQLLQRGIEEFWKHPIAGLDSATIFQNMQDLRQGEGIVDFVNGYLFFTLLGGIGALIAMLVAFILPALMMLRSRRRLSIEGLALDRYAGFCAAICGSYVVSTAFTAFGGRLTGFLYFVMGIASILFAWRRVPREQLIATARQPKTRRRLKRLFEQPGHPEAEPVTS